MKKEKPTWVLGLLTIGAVSAFPSKTYVLVNPDVTFKPKIISRLETTLNSQPDIAIVVSLSYFILTNQFNLQFADFLRLTFCYANIY